MRREHLDIAERYLARPGAIGPALRRALRHWHAAETGMLAYHQTARGEIGPLFSTLANATRVSAAWPLTLTEECLRWSWASAFRRTG